VTFVVISFTFNLKLSWLQLTYVRVVGSWFKALGLKEQILYVLILLLQISFNLLNKYIYTKL
jgi:hypothetical protein